MTASKQPFTFYLIAACIYLCLTIVAMSSLALMEKRAARGFRRAYA